MDSFRYKPVFCCIVAIVLFASCLEAAHPHQHGDVDDARRTHRRQSSHHHGQHHGHHHRVQHRQHRYHRRQQQQQQQQVRQLQMELDATQQALDPVLSTAGSYGLARNPVLGNSSRRESNVSSTNMLTATRSNHEYHGRAFRNNARGDGGGQWKPRHFNYKRGHGSSTRRAHAAGMMSEKGSREINWTDYTHSIERR